MQITAWSKINLYLKVTARRTDGYHELKTLFLPLCNPADTVSLTDSSGGLDVRSNDPSLPAGADNLAGKAAMLYAGKCGLTPDWNFDVVKNIPVAAGMGGGSSDAAAALLLLNRRYGKLSQGQLAELALALGADVPFFLNPRPGFAYGVGEKLELLDFPVPDLPLLIVNPRFPVSAKWAYTHLSPSAIGEEDGGQALCLTQALKTGDLSEIARNIRNDLAPAIYNKFPLLTQLREFLCRNGALNADITGSGPTLYAISPSRAASLELEERVKSKYGDAILTAQAEAAGEAHKI